MSNRDIDTLARTIYGEARGEPIRGKVAVANVVLNRLARPGWWTRERGDGIPDDTIEAACRDPWQFSCWLETDPNLPKLKTVTTDDLMFVRCLNIAELAAEGCLVDVTNGADHYHATSMGWPKRWGQKREPLVTIGNHRFYRL